MEEKKEEVKTKKIKRIRCKIVKPAKFKECIKLVDSLITEADLVFSKDGLEIVGRDTTNVVMVIWNMPSNQFSEFEVTEETKVGINLKNFSQILKRMTDEGLGIEVIKNKICLTVEGKNKVKKEFNLPILDLGLSDRKLPALEFKTSVVVLTKDIISALEDVKLISGEGVIFSVDNKLTLKSIEGQASSVESEMDISSKKTAKAEAKYSLEYLDKMLSKIADTVKVEFNKDYPIQVSYDIEGISLKIILAPRIDNN